MRLKELTELNPDGSFAFLDEHASKVIEMHKNCSSQGILQCVYEVIDQILRNKSGLLLYLVDQIMESFVSSSSVSRQIEFLAHIPAVSVSCHGDISVELQTK